MGESNKERIDKGNYLLIKNILTNLRNFLKIELK